MTGDTLMCGVTFDHAKHITMPIVHGKLCLVILKRFLVTDNGVCTQMTHRNPRLKKVNQFCSMKWNILSP